MDNKNITSKAIDYIPNSPTFTRKHYEAIASTLNAARLLKIIEANYVVDLFSKGFALDNPAFDAAKFKKACGL